MKRLIISVLFGISLLNACTAPSNQSPAKVEDAKTDKVENKKPMKVPEVMDFAEFQERIKTTDDTLYIYNFWATWCMPCVKEMPYFEQIHDEFADQKVKLIFVSLDFLDMLSTKLLPFMIKRDLSEDVWLLNERNPNSWIDKVSTEWTGSIPATLFSHPPSNFKAFYERSFEYDDLKEAVEGALKEVRK